MLEHPSQASGVAFRVSGAADGVEGEANAENPSNSPMRDAVAEEVEQDPGCDHGDDGSGLRVRGSRRGEGKAGGCDPGNLKSISGNDRKPAKEFSLRTRI